MKKFFCLIIALCTIFSCSSGAYAENIKFTSSVPEPANFPGGLKINDNTTISTFSLRRAAAAGAELTFEEYLRQELESFARTIDISAYRITQNDFRAMYNTFIFSNSDLPVLTGCDETTDSNGYMLTVTPFYVYGTKSEYDEKYSRMCSLTDSLAEYASKGKTDLEKALLAYDKIVLDYDYAPDESGSFTQKHRTPYSFMDDGVAVCQGYSILYKLVLDKLGIENYLCTNSDASVNHSWNYVKLGGKWYHSDTTFGEIENSKEEINHTYFLMSDSRLLQEENHGSKADWVMRQLGCPAIDCADTTYDSGYLFNYFYSPFLRDEKSIIFTPEFLTGNGDTFTLTFRSSSLKTSGLILSEEKDEKIYVVSLWDSAPFRIVIAAYTPLGRFINCMAAYMPTIPGNEMASFSILSPEGAKAGDSLKYMLLKTDFITPLSHYSETTVKE